MVKDNFSLKLDYVRASAIILVLLFHLNLFELGYLGVDLFFFLSGFLIAATINKHSISDYYIRRILRIIPPAFTLLALNGFIGFLFLSSDLYKLLSVEIVEFLKIHLDGWLLNNQNYFSPDVKLQPLIHLWSLTTELKLYIIAPLFIFLINRASNRILMITGILLPFIYSVLIFYFPNDYLNWVIKIFPFLSGQICYAIYKEKIIIKSVYLKIALLILLPIFIFYNAKSAILLLILINLTIYFILFLKINIINNISKVIIWFSTRSFAIYLVHWSVISWSFILFNIEANSSKFQFILFIVIIVLSEVWYRFIESPNRASKIIGLPNNKRYVYFSLILIFGILLYHSGMYIRNSNGFSSRFIIPGTKIHLFNFDEEQKFRRLDLLDSQIIDKNNLPTILIVGDSFSGDIARSISKNGSRINEYKFINIQGIKYNCIPWMLGFEANPQEGFECKNPNTELFFNLNSRAQKIIFSYRWGEHGTKPDSNWQEFIGKMKKFSLPLEYNKYVFINRRIEFYPSTSLLVSSGVNKYLPIQRMAGVEIDRLFYEKKYREIDIDKYISDFEEMCVKNNYRCIQFKNFQCNSEAMKCAVVDQEGMPIYLDIVGHLTRAGALFFSDRLWDKVFE